MTKGGDVPSFLLYIVVCRSDMSSVANKACHCEARSDVAIS